MNLEERLNQSLNDILRTSGYVFEIINNNKRQSNLITGPNNQLIPPPMMEQLSQKIAGFELILDETVMKFNDAPWCVDQIVQNKKKQEEQKIQEEMERQKREEEERKRKAEEEALAQKKKQQQEQEQEEQAARLREREREEKARQEEQQRLSQERAERENQQNIQNMQNQRELQQQQNQENSAGGQNDLMDSNFDLDMDMDKDLEIPNPADILSMNFKDQSGNDPRNGLENGASNNTDPGDIDMNSMMKGDDALLDDLNMDLLGQDFDEGLGGAGEEEFDVENFLNQFGHGD